MLKVKIKSAKLKESGPSGVIEQSIIIGSDSGDVVYSLIDSVLLENFCHQIKKDYEDNGVDPDITPDILIDKGIIISSVKVNESGECGYAEFVLAGVNLKYRRGRLGEKLFRLVFSQYPKGMTVDRGFVSAPARRLWRRLRDDLGDDQVVDLPAQCQTYKDADADILNSVYKLQGEKADKYISSGKFIMQRCEEILTGLWDQDSIVSIIDAAGKELFTRGITVALS